MEKSYGIFELRAKVGTDISRVLYFFYYEGKIIMTNGFVKKTQKTPKEEIQIVLKRYLEKIVLYFYRRDLEKNKEKQ